MPFFLWIGSNFFLGNNTLPNICNSVTTYSIQDDALKTGELDYVNGGINEIHICSDI